MCFVTKFEIRTEIWRKTYILLPYFLKILPWLPIMPLQAWTRLSKAKQCYIQYAFLNHLHLLLHLRVKLSTYTHSSFTWSKSDEDCVLLSSAVFKICGHQSANVSYNLRFEVHCMQSVICSLQSANVRHHPFGAKICSDIVGENYRFREENTFPRAELKENCQLRGTDNVQGQISEHILRVK